MEDPLAGYYLSGGFVKRPPGSPPEPPMNTVGNETHYMSPPQNEVPNPSIASAPPAPSQDQGGGDDSGAWGNGQTNWGGSVPQQGYLGGNRGANWDSSVRGSATSDWRSGSTGYDRNTGGSFIGDWTGGALGRQTTGQGINQGYQNLGWDLTAYGNFANIDTPIGSIGLLPGQGLAKLAGGALLDHQIDAIDSSYDALDGGSQVPGAAFEGDDTVTVSDRHGNVREFGARQYSAIEDLQRNDYEASRVGRREDANGNFVNFNVTPENQLSNANSTWESSSFGNRGEAEAVASQGWSSDAHFDAIDSQFDALDSASPSTAGDSIGGGGYTGWG